MREPRAWNVIKSALIIDHRFIQVREDLLEHPDDALNGRDVCEYRNDDDCYVQRQAVEIQTEPPGGKPKEDHPFRPLHHAYLAVQPQPLRPGTGIADHDGPPHGQHDDIDHGQVLHLGVDGVVQRCQPDVHHDFRDAVQRGVVKGPELRSQAALSGHPAVQQIEQSSDEDEEPGGPDVVHVEEPSSQECDREPHGGDGVGVDAPADQATDQPIGGPVHGDPEEFEADQAHGVRTPRDQVRMIRLSAPF